MKTYHEDFERERHAREAAIKVKNLAEERMKKMERDMKELRDRLNQQAARRLREDQVRSHSYSTVLIQPSSDDPLPIIYSLQYDDQPPFGEQRRSAEHRFADTQPSNLTDPNRFSGQHQFSGHQEIPVVQRPRSGQQHSGPQFQQHSGLQYQMGHVIEPSASIASPGAPPLPPKGIHGTPPTTAGGFGGIVMY